MDIALVVKVSAELSTALGACTAVPPDPARDYWGSNCRTTTQATQRTLRNFAVKLTTTITF